MSAGPAKSLLNSLPGVVIPGFVTAIGFSLWLVTDSRDDFGPTVLVTGGDGHVYLNIGPVLYELDARGRLPERIPLADAVAGDSRADARRGL